jgi:hypothetical protein
MARSSTGNRLASTAFCKLSGRLVDLVDSNHISTQVRDEEVISSRVNKSVMRVRSILATTVGTWATHGVLHRLKWLSTSQRQLEGGDLRGLAIIQSAMTIILKLKALLMRVGNEAFSIRSPIKRIRDYTLRCDASPARCHGTIVTNGHRYKSSCRWPVENLIRDVKRFARAVVSDPTWQVVPNLGRRAQSQRIPTERQVVDRSRVVRCPQVCRTCGTTKQRQKE